MSVRIDKGRPKDGTMCVFGVLYSQRCERCEQRSKAIGAPNRHRPGRNPDPLRHFSSTAITDERLRWLSNPDYARSEPGRIAAELLVAREALRMTQRLFDEALPKFDWGRSALDANAIALLNEVPRQVAAAISWRPR